MVIQSHVKGGYCPFISLIGVSTAHVRVTDDAWSSGRNKEHVLVEKDHFGCYLWIITILCAYIELPLDEFWLSVNVNIQLCSLWLKNMRICAFNHCSNSTYTLNRWSKKTCKQHKIIHTQCGCKIPFALFPFPTEKKNLDARMVCAGDVNRADATTGRNWKPGEYDRICSDHFVDGKPTTANPYPKRKS